ncbi:glycosyltransferase family 2 protein [Microbulbifer halophilus]|uniref:Glycosyltransferase family 2 protein n=1 Tax=Microbulbifer halophilus TaxID=453963 RepID=A0ABW5E800_9GAMM|nr:glycosyltransferase family A protein [Microbulbifer halophilus]MCW8126805.1 glycosyltransferase family A protein [Microbulbifer halophilus]
MHIFVFSYNRGPFLDNCIRSIEECAPDCRLTVIDDGSDDGETRAVLERIGERHRVISKTADSGHKLGGLYANMQAAYELAGEDELICFLQDDTQMVRRLTAEDIRAFEQYFEREPKLGFISPAFVRGISLKHAADRDFRFDKASDLWFWYPKKRSTGTWFSALLIASTRRLRQVNWQFEVGESVNNRQAGKVFCRMGRLRAPFAMWLPNGRAYRGKQKSLALRFGEWRRRCGIYPLELMGAADVAKLQAAEPPRLPVAEEILQLRGGVRLKVPWTYDPMQGASLLKLLDRLERKLKH